VDTAAAVQGTCPSPAGTESEMVAGGLWPASALERADLLLPASKGSRLQLRRGTGREALRLGFCPSKVSQSRRHCMCVGDLTFIKEVFILQRRKVGVEGDERGPSVMLVRYTFFCARKMTDNVLRVTGSFHSLLLFSVEGDQ